MQLALNKKYRNSRKDQSTYVMALKSWIEKLTYSGVAISQEATLPGANSIHTR